MHPLDCPEFEYKDHPRKAEVLKQRQLDIYTWVEERRISVREAVADSRPFHEHLFEELCPEDYRYFAGHYRGEKFRCLLHYPVGVGGDPMVGVQPQRVSGLMAELAVAVRAGITALDEAFRAPRSHLSMAQRAVYAVAFACRVFVQFLTIHPYANGNGHIARFCLVAILARYGLILRGWAIEPRPDPPYLELIYRYRRGEYHLLEREILQRCKAT